VAGAFKLPRSPWPWLRLLLVAALLYWVVERNGRGRIIQALLNANPAWTVVGALAFFVSILAGAYQWHLLLRLQGIRYGYRASFNSYYSGLFLNNFLPGTVGGDALRVWDVHRSEASGVGKAAAATLLDRLLGFSALAFFSLLALAYEFQRNVLPRDLLRHLMWMVAIIFLCFAAILLPLLSRRTSKFLHMVIRILRLRRVDTAYAKIQLSLTAYKARWREMGYMFVLACLVQFLRVTTQAFSAWALHLSLAPSLFFSFVPLIALAAVLPLNVGGWGLPQGLAVYLYALPGVFAVPVAGYDVHSAAAALAFLPTAIGMVVMLGGGFYFVLRPSSSSGRRTA
jgi:glycosyltransferase 2 family protein